MKEIRKTSQFKKDYKRFKNDKEFVETLMGIVKLLAEGNLLVILAYRVDSNLKVCHL